MANTAAFTFFIKSALSGSDGLLTRTLFLGGFVQHCALLARPQRLLSASHISGLWATTLSRLAIGCSLGYCLRRLTVSLVFGDQFRAACLPFALALSSPMSFLAGLVGDSPAVPLVPGTVCIA